LRLGRWPQLRNEFAAWAHSPLPRALLLSLSYSIMLPSCLPLGILGVLLIRNYIRLLSFSPATWALTPMTYSYSSSTLFPLFLLAFFLFGGRLSASQIGALIYEFVYCKFPSHFHRFSSPFLPLYLFLPLVCVLVLLVFHFILLCFTLFHFKSFYCQLLFSLAFFLGFSGITCLIINVPGSLFFWHYQEILSTRNPNVKTPPPSTSFTQQMQLQLHEAVKKRKRRQVKWK